MRFINGWNYLYKDRDRVEFTLRVSIVTLFSIFIDFSAAEYKVTLLNFSLRS